MGPRNLLFKQATERFLHRLASIYTLENIEIRQDSLSLLSQTDADLCYEVVSPEAH